jgi:hypothetical protein
MVVVVIEAKGVVMREDGLIIATIMVVIHQILTNLHKMMRNKKGGRIYIVEISRRYKMFVIDVE